MYLSRYEERLLNGEFGEAKALAMRVLVRVGEALGAQELIEISHAHISGISYFNIGDAGLELINDLVHHGGHVETFTSANPYMVLEDFLGFKHDEEVINKQLTILKLLNSLGIAFYTCAPYNVRPPKYGEHLAWAESNAVLYANSVLGARTNKEGGPIALFAALVGRTYKAGIHLDDGRVPEVLINVESLKNPIELSFLGLLVGELIGNRIAYVGGVRFRSISELKLFLSSVGTSSNTAMLVIEGITPDSNSLYSRADFKESFKVTYTELQEYVRKFKKLVRDGRGLYLIGCPHLSYGELIEVLGKLASKADRVPHLSNVFKDRELWVMTSKMFLTHEVKEVLSKLLRYNVKVLTDCCAVVSRLDKLRVDYVVTNSIKALSYVSRLSRVPAIAMELDDLINTYFLGLDVR